jgi:hypothetical protein
VFKNQVPWFAIPLCEGSLMERINLAYWYHFGWTISELYTILFADYPLTDTKWTALDRTVELLHGFLALPSEHYQLLKSQQAAAEFLESLSPFVQMRGVDKVLDANEGKAMLDAINKFVNVFRFDMEDRHVYLATGIGAYSIPKLIENADSHLSVLAQKSISYETRSDFFFAGKCLAFDLYTASGFHALRSVEDMARTYHKAITGCAEPTTQNLGPLINDLRTELEKEEGTKVSESPLGLIITLLARINKAFRSPIMHPEMTLGYNSAKFVFDLAALVISDMVEDLGRRGKLTSGPVTAKPS